jgi:aryl-phospho-beta-D-glucosidase BglC (GH1 family)
LKHGIGILLDMHGTPGSQNGYDNSSPGSVGQKEWGKHPENVNQTIESLEKYAVRYGTKEALVGFDLINEPSSQATSLEVLQDFYKRAYTAVRKHSDAWVLIMPLQEGDSGQNDHWAKFMNKDQNYTKVGMDIHMYSCFGGASDQNTMDGVTNYVKNDIKNWIAQYIKVNPKPMLVGEWSACQHADKTKFGDFFKTEWEVFGTANLGQTFWSYSDQGIPADQPSGYCDKDAWSLKTAIKNGWVGNLTTAC